MNAPSLKDIALHPEDRRSAGLSGTECSVPEPSITAVGTTCEGKGGESDVNYETTPTATGTEFGPAVAQESKVVHIAASDA